jgi:hypothetical protein
MTQITKEAVLKAAEKSTPKEALKELFPEYFEEDTLAIKKGAFSSREDDNLMAFSLKSLGDSYAIQISNWAEKNNPARFRSLYVSEVYEVKVRPSTKLGGTTIEIHKK